MVSRPRLEGVARAMAAACNNLAPVAPERAEDFERFQKDLVSEDLQTMENALQRFDYILMREIMTLTGTGRPDEPMLGLSDIDHETKVRLMRELLDALRNLKRARIELLREAEAGRSTSPAKTSIAAEDMETTTLPELPTDSWLTDFRLDACRTKVEGIVRELVKCDTWRDEVTELWTRLRDVNEARRAMSEFTGLIQQRRAAAVSVGNLDKKWVDLSDELADAILLLEAVGGIVLDEKRDAEGATLGFSLSSSSSSTMPLSVAMRSGGSGDYDRSGADGGRDGVDDPSSDGRGCAAARRSRRRFEELGNAARGRDCAAPRGSRRRSDGRAPQNGQHGRSERSEGAATGTCAGA